MIVTAHPNPPRQQGTPTKQASRTLIDGPGMDQGWGTILRTQLCDGLTTHRNIPC